MNITTSITIVLFVLLTAQIASAYYCPSTGRWLSRDPIGEPGFQTSQMAGVVRSIAGSPQLRTSRWINRDPLDEGGAKNLYRFVLNNPISYWDPDGRKVQMCCRNVDVNATANCLAKICGAKHCWVKTDTKTAGMGPAGTDALPSSPCCGTKTAIKDHSNETGATCYDIPSADENCINNALEIGKPLGDWSAGNNCNTFAQGVVKGCGGKNKCNLWYSQVYGSGDLQGFDICLDWSVPPSVLPPDSYNY